MIAKYIFLALVSLAADILAVILAPLAACFITKTSGGRDNIWAIWRWITTHDAYIDEGYRGGYFKVPTTSIGRWWARVRWIWRNPAYQVDHWLGYDQTSAVIIKHLDGKKTWDTGKPSKSYWTAINSKGQKAFLYERQIQWLFNFTLELQFGWKLYRNDSDKICMLALRISPFKRYAHDTENG